MSIYIFSILRFYKNSLKIFAHTIKMKEIQEYIWLGGNGEFRSKVKVEEHGYPITEWNYDGSSTGQASDSGNTEINLRPVYKCINPLANPNSQFNCLLIEYRERTR